MSNISLYGNLIVDTIKYVNNFNENQSNTCNLEFSSIGGIGNLVKNFKLLQNNQKLNIVSSIGKDYYGNQILNEYKSSNNLDINNLLIDESNKTSNSIIISDVEKNIKTSIVNWGACRKMTNFVPIETDWSHICYADTLNNLNENSIKAIREKSGFVSFDLCQNKIQKNIEQTILPLMKYADFLITSDTEIFSLNVYDEADLRSLCRKLHNEYNINILVHYPSGSFLCTNKEEYEYTLTPIEKNIDVLGAGDSFCSAFVDSLLNNKYNFEKAIAFSHKHATNVIQNSTRI